MKLEIDLDLNQIDYEAINKQIQEKIAAMDLKNEYQISKKIDSQIRENTKQEVDHYFENGYWGSLTTNAEREIKDEISKNIKELIKPHVENVFNQISQEEFNEIIYELLPQVLVNMLSSNMRTALNNYYHSSNATLMSMCENRIRSILNR